jgi:hypothetical protein
VEDTTTTTSTVTAIALKPSAANEAAAIFLKKGDSRHSLEDKVHSKADEVDRTDLLKSRLLIVKIRIETAVQHGVVKL